MGRERRRERGGGEKEIQNEKEGRGKKVGGRGRSVTDRPGHPYPVHTQTNEQSLFTLATQGRDRAVAVTTTQHLLLYCPGSFLLCLPRFCLNPHSASLSFNQ